LKFQARRRLRHGG